MSQKSEPLVLRPASPVESFGEMARNVKSVPPFLEFPRCKQDGRFKSTRSHPTAIISTIIIQNTAVNIYNLTVLLRGKDND